MKEMTKQDFIQQIWDEANDIIEMCGISIHMTDIYFACISDFTEDEKHSKKVLKMLEKKYNIKLSHYTFYDDMPLALLVLSFWDR